MATTVRPMGNPLQLPSDDLPSLAAFIRARAEGLGRPCVVALDGRSGVGKSTLAARLAAEIDGTVVDGDGFYAGGVVVRTDSPRARAESCIDWKAQRVVLESLRAGREARYHAFDWEAFDGRSEAVSTVVGPSAFVVLEGVYAARPELRDLVDVRLLLTVDDQTRLARLQAREGGLGPWDLQWHEAEVWYFSQTVTASSFDVVLMSVWSGGG
jgi:hypothetical protein